MSLIEYVNENVIPRSWSKNRSVKLTDLQSGSSEYLGAMEHMAIIRSKIKVKKIVRVENPFLYGAFQLRLEENKLRTGSTCIQTLVHDTAWHNVDSITNYNLDWRRAVRCKFGRGVSFSSSAAYAVKYSSRSNGYRRAMIITDVIVGNQLHTELGRSYVPDGYDTTVSNRSKVYVKYRDDEFYPKYVIYYELDDDDSD